MAPSKYWPIYVGIFVPLFLTILSVTLVLGLQPKPRKPAPSRTCRTNSDCLNGGECSGGKCVCPPEWTGDLCQTVAVAPAMLHPGGMSCGASPVPCATDGDCVKCNGNIPFVCSQLNETDTNKYCLPEKPTNQCGDNAGPGQYAHTIPGQYVWQGWQDVETQAWTCDCEYPRYYPQDPATGQCVKSAALCAYGTWHYPCIGTICELSPENERKLVGTPPLQNGYCDCSNTACTTDADCASNVCAGGVCQYQRLALDPKTAMPTCVKDTCAPFGKWKDNGKPPYTYGYCECGQGSVNVGNACVSPSPPPVPSKCYKGCSNHGRCLSNGTCVCSDGWTGKGCEQPVCAMGCDGRGKCVGPNQCTCPSQSYYDARSDECVKQVACTPPPVDPVTGKLDYSKGGFANSTQTQCGAGTAAQVNELCQATACTQPGKCNQDGSDRWDRATGDLDACWKNVSCADSLCATNYCTDAVTSKTGPIQRHPSEDGSRCEDPLLDDVKQLCSQSGPSRVLFYNSQTGLYTCLDFATQNNIQVVSVTAQEGMGVEGTLCIAFDTPAFAQAALVADGGGVQLFYKLYYTQDLNNNDLESPPLLAGGAVDLVKLTPVSTCTGYYYAFRIAFNSAQPAMTLAPDADVTMQLFAVPLTRWSCLAPTSGQQDTNFVVDTCTSPYNNLGVPVQLTPYTPIPGYSRALAPTLLPCVAQQLAKDAGWLTSALTSKPNVEEKLNLENLKKSKIPILEADCNLPSNVVTQVMCTNAYCRTGSIQTAFKVNVMAWEYLREVDPLALTDACPFMGDKPLPVKYELTRRENTGGVTPGPPTTLISAKYPPPVVQRAGLSVAYFVDIVPADTQRTYEYTLLAFIASSDDADDTTYTSSMCRAQPETFSVTVYPYTQRDCATIAAPMTNVTPPTTWLNNGTCYWDPQDYAAKDYYCAITRAGGGTTFPYTTLALADNAGQCASLGKRYPNPGSVQNWPGMSCTPSAQVKTMYACVAGTYALDQPLQLNAGAVQVASTPDGVNGVSFDDVHREMQMHKDTGTLEVALSQTATPKPYYQYLMVVYTLSGMADPNDEAYLSTRVNNTFVLQTLFSPPITAVMQASDLGVQKVSRYSLYTDVPFVWGKDVFPVLTLTSKMDKQVTVNISTIGFTTTIPDVDKQPFACEVRPYGTHASKAECCAKCPNSNCSSMGVVTGETCFTTTGGAYDTSVCIGGAKETRKVTCDPTIPFVAGQGMLADKQNLETRLQALKAFYDRVHTPEFVPVINESFMNDADAVYKQYARCGPSIAAQTYGVAGACDSLDDACTMLQATATQCGGRNVCDAWVKSSNGVDYSQTRMCFPDKSVDGAKSPCCDCSGSYSLGLVDGKQTGQCE